MRISHLSAGAGSLPKWPAKCKCGLRIAAWFVAGDDHPSHPRPGTATAHTQANTYRHTHIGTHTSTHTHRQTHTAHPSANRTRFKWRQQIHLASQPASDEWRDDFDRQHWQPQQQQQPQGQQQQQQQLPAPSPAIRHPSWSSLSQATPAGIRPTASAAAATALPVCASFRLRLLLSSSRQHLQRLHPPASLPPPPPSSQLLLCLHNMAMSMTLFASQPRRRLATRMRCAPFRPGHAPWQGRGRGQWVLGCRTTRAEAKFASLVLPAKISKNERTNLRYAHPALWSGIYISSERTTSCRYYTVDTHTHTETHTHTRIHTYVNEYTLRCTWPAGL